MADKLRVDAPRSGSLWFCISSRNISLLLCLIARDIVSSHYLDAFVGELSRCDNIERRERSFKLRLRPR
jgi:hypothetical protein